MKKISMLFLLVNMMLFNISSASMLIWPTNLQMDSKEKATGLWVENRSQNMQVLQARVYAWHHKNGQDELVPQSNVMVSPPMAKVMPGKKQIFRIVNRAGVPANTLQSYRIILDEVPQKVNAKADGDEAHQGVQFQFRYSIPLFLYGQGLSNTLRQKLTSDELAKELTWSISQGTNGNLLKITNNSSYYMNVSSLTGTQEAASDIGGYILPKSSRQWEVPNSIKDSLYGRINNDEEKVKIGR